MDLLAVYILLAIRGTRSVAVTGRRPSCRYLDARPARCYSCVFPVKYTQLHPRMFMLISESLG